MRRMIPFLACVPLLLSLLFTSHLSRGSFNRDKPPKSTFRTKGPLQGDKPAVPMEVELSFSNIPLLNQIAVLNLSVTPLRDAPNTTIMFDLPAKAFKVISGETKMTENISAGETRIYSIEVLPIALGQYALVGNAISKQGTFVFGRRSELFVSLDNEWTTRTSRTDIFSGPPRVYSEGRKVSDSSLQPKRLIESNKPGQWNPSAGVAVPGPGQIVVRGTFLYQNRTNVNKPLRDARVEIWDHNASPPDRLLSTTHADNSGHYESGVISNSDPEGGTLDVYVKVFSTDDFSVHVTDASANLYFFQTQTTANVADGFVDTGTFTITDSVNRAAYYIYDTIANDAYDYLFALGWSNSFNLPVRWPSGGTFFSFPAEINLVLGDRWDSDVFLHEYGHFVMDKIYGDDAPIWQSPCGSHAWGEHTPSVGCGFSEGWADFLEAAIQNEGNYDDTEDVTYHLEYEPPIPNAHHAEDEGGVCASLWDIFDSGPEPWDTISEGINGTSNNGIWKIFRDSKPSDFIEFYNNWVISANGSNAEVTSILHHHLIITQPFPNTLQFSSNSYNASESAGKLTVTITRSGDNSVAATVDYATTDGTATERSDYTTTAGTLHFAPSETAKSFDLLINDDSFVEGPESFTVKLSNASGASLAVQSTANVQITDDVSEPTTNVIDDPLNYVSQHYHDFLNRQADPSGLAFWTNEITSCGANTQCVELKRINVSGAFFLSIEFQQTGYLVHRIYKAAYGDGIGTSTLGGSHQLSVPVMRLNEFLSNTQEIGQGVVVGQTGWEQVLENNKQALAEEFVQRARFRSAYPDSMPPATFIDTLNTNAGNPLSQSERNQLVNDLTSGAKTRGQALRAVAEDPDLFNAESNRAFVLMQYFGYLRRNPNSAPDSDYTGYDFWLTKLNQFGGNFVNAEMVKAFISSGEYRHRFGSQ